MIVSCIDGHYDTRKRIVYTDGETPPGAADAVTIAVPVAEVRAVYEGCWYERAIAFSKFAVSSERLSPRQRALVRDDPGLGRHFRRIAMRIRPETIAALREAWGGRCIPQRVLIRAALDGTAAEQIRAAAAVVGR